MGRDEEAAERLIAAARALRAAYPDRLAMARVDFGGPPAGPEAPPGLRRALGFLLDEMLLVRAGGAEGPWVLDDEMARAEAALRGARPG